MIGRFVIALGLMYSAAFSQVSQNVSLFGTLNPEPIHYAGSWYYADSAGTEYALLAAYTYTSIIDIADSTNIHEVAAIPGASSNWREITVIGDYAFTVSEGVDTLAGMQVIYLGDLPDSAALVTVFDSTFGSAHMIQKDMLGNEDYVYVSGSGPGTARGVHIIDVSDPINPVEVGAYGPYYAHDCHVRGDTMYVAAILQPWVDVVDISDKANPVLIAQIIYSDAASHSCWTTRTGSHLFVCDEQDGLLGKIFDVTDLQNVSLAATYTANDSSLVHNVYIHEDFAYVTHNTEGLRIVDMLNPAVPVEVGFYDTEPGPSGGFKGLWSACPYLPSGKIIGGNRSDGLYVWRFNSTYAGRIFGEVVDSLSGNPISGATIQLLQTGKMTTSNQSGEYAFGEVPGTYDLQYAAAGYFTKTLTGVTLSGMDSLWHRVELRSLQSGLPGLDLQDIILRPDHARSSLELIIPESLANTDLQLEIFNMSGKRLAIWPEIQNGNTIFPMETGAAGVLLYRLSAQDYLIKTAKFIWK